MNARQMIKIKHKNRWRSGTLKKLGLYRNSTIKKAEIAPTLE